MKKALLLFSIPILISACQNQETVSGDKVEQPVSNIPTVSIVGEMRNVMHKGELFGTIHLDTISNKKHLYGLGPIEYLSGEILIIDGKSYVTRVLSDSTMSIQETYDVKAPFFVYSNVELWEENVLPDSIETIQQLEQYLDATTKDMKRPFAFKLVGEVDTAKIHIVNLPKGTEVHSPEEAHQNQKTYLIKNTSVEIIGFFSTEHAGVFIHHDSFVHMHLITEDRKQMGHVDMLNMQQGTFKLYLPKQ